MNLNTVFLFFLVTLAIGFFVIYGVCQWFGETIAFKTLSTISVLAFFIIIIIGIFNFGGRK